jgi:hypothetical protein
MKIWQFLRHGCCRLMKCHLDDADVEALVEGLKDNVTLTELG